MLELALSPSGQLLASENALSDSAESSTPFLAEMRKCLQRGAPELLLQFAFTRQQPMSPIYSFWRRFGEEYLTELSHVAEPIEDLKQPLPPPEDELVALQQMAPPMLGGEYLNVEVLRRLWCELDDYARQEIRTESGGLSAWFQRRSPLWHSVGRVCFHLAENKRDPEYPFAFLATYAPRISSGGRIQYLPLGRALEEYSGDKNKKLLVNLLTPVHRASEQCAWVKQMTDSGDLFHPLVWKPPEAYSFLQDIPKLEASGLLVRVPDWWSKRPARVRVGVAIGNKSQFRLGLDSMLDFKMGLSLNGEALTEDEYRTIMQGSDGLVLLKGRWVQVERKKLKETLEHWKSVEAEAGGDGLSFIQGMRLLAGAPADPDLQALPSEENANWSDVHAGEWLEERLRQLREPGTAATLPGTELHATLRPYQEAGVKWLWTLSRLGLGACLADDMGLGKTVQIIALLLLHRRAKTSGKRRPVLVVLPVSLLGNWKAEIEKFAPSLQCAYAHPSMMKPAEMNGDGDPPTQLLQMDVVFTTYSMLPRLQWLTKTEWELLILDEAQAIKNPAARQTRAAKLLKAGARIALTGTPVENRLGDLWSLFDFLCSGLLGSARAFRNFIKTMESRTTEQYAPLRKLVSPYILRRMKTDKSVIADLPDKIEMVANCSLSKKQAALYERSVQELEAGLKEKDGIARRGMVLAFILRFKQICNHPAQWLGSGDYTPDESGKFVRLRELCEEIGSRQEKVLVFTQFREITIQLAAVLGGIFGRTGLVLHGGTEVKRRKQLVDEFQGEGGPPFMVLSLRAGGTGLNLTAAGHVIHFDRWWNPAVENQATDRAFRIGQKKNVMVHKFVCQGTIEEKIDALIREKTALAGEILQEGVPKLITEMSDTDLLNLVRLDVNRALED